MTAIVRIVTVAALIALGQGAMHAGTEIGASTSTVAAPAESGGSSAAGVETGCDATELADSGSNFCQTCDCAVDVCRDSCAKCR